MAYATRDGVPLYYEQEGRGRPALVFVHGWCCDHTFFGPLVDHFRRSHAVLTLDLRGCGSSGQPEDGYDVPTLADDVAWLCGETGFERPVIVGHSLGGSIGLELAARHPDVPAAVVALDPGPIHATPLADAVYDGLATQLAGPSGEAVREAWIRSDAPAHRPDLAVTIIDTMCSAPIGPAAQVIRGTVEWNGAAALAMCDVPLLVVLSQSRGSNAPDRLLALKPDVHIGITVGAGHFHQLEVPEQVIPMMERFLTTAVGDPAD
jgi:pimeloyl-ACP methyl ester carboxylesterase